jgi:hypothetical protein
MYNSRKQTSWSPLLPCGWTRWSKQQLYVTWRMHWTRTPKKTDFQMLQFIFWRFGKNVITWLLTQTFLFYQDSFWLVRRFTRIWKKTLVMSGENNTDTRFQEHLTNGLVVASLFRRRDGHGLHIKPSHLLWRKRHVAMWHETGRASPCRRTIRLWGTKGLF